MVLSLQKLRQIDTVADDSFSDIRAEGGSEEFPEDL